MKVAFQQYSVFVSVALSASTPQLPDTAPQPAGSGQTHTCSHTSLPSGHCLNTLVRKRLLGHVFCHPSIVHSSALLPVVIHM